MATSIKTGAIKRKGAAGLSLEMARYLKENEKVLQELYDDIDSHAAMFREQVEAAGVASAKNEKEEAGLVAIKAELDEIRDTIAVDRDAAKAENDANMGALSRRTAEVEHREVEAVARDLELEARSKEIEDTGRERETELAERERIVEEQETDLEVKQLEFIKVERAQGERRQSIETEAKIIKAAADRIGL